MLKYYVHILYFFWIIFQTYNTYLRVKFKIGFMLFFNPIYENSNIYDSIIYSDRVRKLLHLHVFFYQPFYYYVSYKTQINYLV